ncbi:MAG: hypothetical protein ACE5HV_17505 [Acidobacteriota bacterium]
MIGQRPWARGLLVAALFLALALVATWPLAKDPAHLSPASLEDNDFRFNLYVIFWGAHALTTDPLNLHQMNMFYPERYTFAYSDMELSQSLLMLPVILVTNNPILTYNLLLIISICLGGIGFYLLALDLTGNRGAALFGAAIFIFNPAHFARYQQIQLFSDNWMPWFAWALLRWLREMAPEGDHRQATTSRRLWPLAAASFFCLQALSGAHPALFAAILGAAMVLYYGIVEALWRRPPFWMGLLVMGLVSAAVLVPIFWPYMVVEKEMLPIRTAWLQLVRGSAAPPELLSAGSRLYRWLDNDVGWPTALFHRPPRTYLFPGLIPLVLAAVGAFSGNLRRHEDRLFWLLFFLLCLWLALGPYAGLYLLIEKMPVVRLIRVPSRIFLQAAFALAALSAYGVASLSGKLAGSSWRLSIFAALALLFAIESLQAPLPTDSFTPGPAPRHQFLAAQPGDFAVVEFPLDPHDYTTSARQIFNSIYHWKKLLVGYSGFQTRDNVRRLRRLNRKFPSDSCLNSLQRLDVKYVIVREDRLPAEILQALRHQPRLRLVFRADETTGVYSLERS